MFGLIFGGTSKFNHLGIWVLENPMKIQHEFVAAYRLKSLAATLQGAHVRSGTSRPSKKRRREAALMGPTQTAPPNLWRCLECPLESVRNMNLA